MRTAELPLRHCPYQTIVLSGRRLNAMTVLSHRSVHEPNARRERPLRGCFRLLGSQHAGARPHDRPLRSARGSAPRSQHHERRQERAPTRESHKAGRPVAAPRWRQAIRDHGKLSQAFQDGADSAHLDIGALNYPAAEHFHAKGPAWACLGSELAPGPAFESQHCEKLTVAQKQDRQRQHPQEHVGPAE